MELDLSLYNPAREYVVAGLSVIPVRADGTKAPIERKWERYAHQIAGEEQIIKWFLRPRSPRGIGIACGPASGNLVVGDFETALGYERWRALIPSDTVDFLDGCPVVRTPSGGYHVWIRLTEPHAGIVLARRPDPADATKGKTLIETRGTGQQVLAPGCPATCHPSGRLYEFVDRGWLDGAAWSPIPVDVFATWCEIASNLNEWHPPARPQPSAPPARRDRHPTDADPGTDFNRRGTWDETGLFEAAWTWERQLDHDRGYVRRPGKGPGEGHSGTIGFVTSREHGWPLFHCFTSNGHPFEAGRSYDRFGVLTRLKHGGDFQAAARALLLKGFGERRSTNGHAGNNGQVPPATENGQAEPDRVEIVLSPDVHVNAEEVIDALAKHDDGLFQFAGRGLVHVRRGVRPPAFLKRSEEVSAIESVDDHHLRCRASRVCRFLSEDKKGELIPKQPPMGLIQAARSIPTEKIRPLTSVITAPTIRPDGSILDQPGYDVSTGLYFDSEGCPLVCVPDRPTRGQVEEAVEVLGYPLADFPFADDCHRAAAFAAILTLAGRFTFSGSVPLFLVDANRAGTGKGLLVDLCVLIATGVRPAAMAPTTDDEEMRKRLVAIALASEAVVKLDNVPEHEFLGTASLESAITAGTVADRLLGGNVHVKLPLRAVFFGTGNNVRLMGDMPRRTCHVRLESLLENPEERHDVREAHLLDHVQDNRGRYLSAALTILRGWFVAGRSQQPLPTWGSFEAWSQVIRQASVWAGLPDPYLTRAKLLASSDPVGAAFRVIVSNWDYLDPNRSGISAARLAELLNSPESDQNMIEKRDALKAAFLEMCPGKGNELPSAKTLGRRLSSLKGRVCDNLRLNGEADRKGVMLWTVKPTA